MEIKRFKGKEILPFIPELANLRIKIFRDYPYLYEGDMDYENHYLKNYAACPESIIVIAFHSDEIIGASSAIPLALDTPEWQKTFLDHHIPLETIFHLNESVLLKPFRNQGIYKYFFTEREKAAKEYGAKITAFAAVERKPHHPLKPKDYEPLDNIWQHFGYQKHPELTAMYEWKDIDEARASFKPFSFWLKNL